MATKIRLTLDVTDEVNERLNHMVEEAGGSKSDLLRKAIALIELAIKAKRTGNQIAVVDPNLKVVTTVVGL
jgi:hypothetical protein